jgi:hypothetical protein
MTPRERAVYYLALSFVGAGLLVVASHQPRSALAIVDQLDRSSVAAAFALVCMVGLSMALSPNWIGRVFRQAPHGPPPGADGLDLGDGGDDGMPRRARVGHHPDCDRFDGHRLRRGEGALCAGCTGLAAGSVAGIALAIAYSIVPFSIEGVSTRALLYGGIALVLADLVTDLVPGRPAAAHATLDALMVVGAFMATVGTLVSTRSLGYGLLAVLVAVMWVDTRVTLSAWRHIDTCGRCPEACKAYLG